MSKSLPARPNLEQLKHQAKDLLKSLQSGEAVSRQRFEEHHPQPSRAADAACSLTDAQLVIAREYGFPTWAKLKQHVESIRPEPVNPHELFKQAFADQDAARFRELLKEFPQAKALINEPVAAFDSPAITQVRTREMLDALLEAGADINARSRWWAGGFGLLDSADPDLAAYAIERGAVVDVHAAARLGMIDRLQELITVNPKLVHSRGGDGQTPLHFASTVEIAKLLLDHGADLDPRDVDHESTPAQHMIRDRQEIVRLLVQRGCQTDILIAAALGDAALVHKHLDADPDCVHRRVDAEHFPMTNHRAGGTIYQWTLGWHVSAHDVARQFGHGEVFRLLLDRSPAEVKLLAHCWAGDEPAVKSLLAGNASVANRLSRAQQPQVAHAARNNDIAAVRVMLAAGLPVAAPGQHRGTPLHWAAFHGNAEMTRVILRYDPPLKLTDADFLATPLGWAMHGSLHGWYCRTGDYAATLELLLAAGAKLPTVERDASEAVKEVLRRHRAKSTG